MSPFSQHFPFFSPFPLFPQKGKHFPFFSPFPLFPLLGKKGKWGIFWVPHVPTNVAGNVFAKSLKKVERHINFKGYYTYVRNAPHGVKSE
jgi:hypothetical protein